MGDDEDDWATVWSGDGVTISSYFPKVTASRGGIRYHWEKETGDVDTLADRRRQLAKKLATDIKVGADDSTPKDEIAALIEDGLSSYAAMLLEELQERLDKEV